MLGVEGLEPTADGVRGVGGWEALEEAQEKGLPLALGPGALGGVVVGAVGGVGEEFVAGVEAVLPRALARLCAHRTQRWSSRRTWGDHQVRSAGGGGGCVVGDGGGRGRRIRTWRGVGRTAGRGTRASCAGSGSGGGGGAARGGWGDGAAVA